jgi:hypothetical protein
MSRDTLLISGQVISCSSIVRLLEGQDSSRRPRAAICRASGS